MKKFYQGNALMMVSFVFVVCFYTAVLAENEQERYTTENVEHDIVLFGDEHDDDAFKYNNYLKATYQYFGGKLEKSLQSFQTLLPHQPSMHVYETYLKLLRDRGAFFSIARIAQQRRKEFDDVFKDNHEIQLIIAQSFLHVGNEKQAEKYFLDLSKQHPNNPQVAYYTVTAFIRGGYLDKALSHIETLLKRKSLREKHFLFFFLKSKIYLMKKNYRLALNAIEHSLSLFPKFDRGWLFKAVLLEQLGNIQEAVKGYERFLELSGPEVGVERQLVQLLFQSRQFKKAARYLKKYKRDSFEYYFDLALIEFKAGNFEKALESIDASLQRNASFNKSQLLKIEILLALKDVGKALAFIGNQLENNPNDYSLVRTLLLLRKKYASNSDVVDVLERVTQKKSKSLCLFAALGDLYSGMKEYEKSFEHYKTVLNLAKDDATKSRALFHMGHACYLQKEYEKMAGLLKRASSFDERYVYPSVYNLLAYHDAQYADHHKDASNVEEKLKHGLTLIDKALRKKPSRFDFLDTKGYILMLLGRRDQAIATLKKAYRQSPLSDNTINKH